MPSIFRSFPFVQFAGLLLLGAINVSAARAATFSDDFDDGNIDGWSLFSPFGNTAVSFPNGNSVRLETGQSPNLAFGPGRGLIYRDDLQQTGDFKLSVDFSNYDDTNHFFGLVARARQPGAGTLDGYLVTYSPQWFTNPSNPRARFAIDRVDNEIRERLIELQFDTLPANGLYQLSLTTSGANLTADLYDLSNPLVPLHTLSANDATYLAGFAGLAVIGSQVNNAAAAATFDNFTLQTIPEPGTWSLILGSLFTLVCLRKHRGTR